MYYYTQYYNGVSWNNTGQKSQNPNILDLALGGDNYNYRIVDENSKVIFKYPNAIKRSKNG